MQKEENKRRSAEAKNGDKSAVRIRPPSNGLSGNKLNSARNKVNKLIRAVKYVYDTSWFSS